MTKIASGSQAHARHASAKAVNSDGLAISYSTACSANDEATQRSAQSSDHHRSSSGVTNVHVDDPYVTFDSPAACAHPRSHLPASGSAPFLRVTARYTSRQRSSPAFLGAQVNAE